MIMRVVQELFRYLRVVRIIRASKHLVVKVVTSGIIVLDLAGPYLEYIVNRLI